MDDGGNRSFDTRVVQNHTWNSPQSLLSLVAQLVDSFRTYKDHRVYFTALQHVVCGELTGIESWVSTVQVDAEGVTRLPREYAVGPSDVTRDSHSTDDESRVMIRVRHQSQQSLNIGMRNPVSSQAKTEEDSPIPARLHTARQCD